MLSRQSASRMALEMHQVGAAADLDVAPLTGAVHERN